MRCGFCGEKMDEFGESDFCGLCGVGYFRGVLVMTRREDGKWVQVDYEAYLVVVRRYSEEV